MSVVSELAGWDSFYLVVGGAAGALIGLQFVVMTLVAERVSDELAAAGAAFASPTVMHFSLTLVLAGLLEAPWQEITIPATLWGLMGFGGIVYAGVVFRRMRRQTAYKPVFEDWLFHIVLPLAAYATLAASALAAPAHVRGALFGVGGAALLLLFVGVHNAWDAIAYHVATHGAAAAGAGRRDQVRRKGEPGTGEPTSNAPAPRRGGGAGARG